MRSPTKASSRNDGRVVAGTKFETRRHTRSRSPQLIGDNISSAQLANASSDDAATAQSKQSMDCDAHPLPTVAGLHKPESNVSSTETGGTDNTIKDISTTGSRSLACVPATYLTAALTRSNVEQHQRELAQFPTDSISGWVHGAGIGDRLAGRFVPSAAYSIRTANSISSMASTTTSQDWQFVPSPMRTDDQVADAGAWCEDWIGPAVYTLSRISLNSE
ncbi:hypothetical protein MMYC01_200569 [Madurella mycetomatis]|uniref:Uncharacterized protein n=1 Tax=Madurella mycetomatis TaxID=100816 RepID=A0A175WJ06_9PEZI|nr:hypothetical protein MMYC01_200569 [Madurella mycetomatis]